MAGDPLRIVDARRKAVGKPKTDKRSCGIQPAHQSVIYRRLKGSAPSHARLHRNHPGVEIRRRTIAPRKNLDKRT